MNIVKISTLRANQTINIPLLITDVQLKRTKPPKNSPYLQFSLSDGFEEIKAMMWDYKDELPEKGSVKLFKAVVGSYLGVNQLTVHAFECVQENAIEAFMPQGNFNIQDYINDVHDLTAEIQNVNLQQLVSTIIRDNAKAFYNNAAACSIHHAYVGGLLKHSVDVAYKARNLASLDINVNTDLCIAGGLLHDIGKVREFAYDGATIIKTLEGELVGHIVLGCMIVEKYRTKDNSTLITLLQHIITSHHGLLEWGSPMTPRSTEAHVVHTADLADARVETIKHLEVANTSKDTWTAKEWSLGNRPALSPSFVEKQVGDD